VAGGCSGEAARPVLRIALAELPEGQPVEAYVGEEPVQLWRRGRQVSARSLWCTHMGCRVRWAPERDRYECPCHEGRFDADGQVISGPALEPLRAMSVTIEGEVVLVEAKAN